MQVITTTVNGIKKYIILEYLLPTRKWIASLTKDRDEADQFEDGQAYIKKLKNIHNHIFTIEEIT